MTTGGGTNTTITGGGPITLEWWGYQTRADVSTPNFGTLFYMDPSLSSCVQGAGRGGGASHPSCDGVLRVDAIAGEHQVRFDYGDSPGVRTTMDADASPHYGRWVHWAVASCGADPACTEPHRIYQDGEVVTEVALGDREYDGKALEGLNLGAMAETWHMVSYYCSSAVWLVNNNVGNYHPGGRMVD